MKKVVWPLITLVMVAVLLLGAIGCAAPAPEPAPAPAPTPAPAPKTIPLRLATHNPSIGFIADKINWFASEANKQTDGVLEIEAFWGGSLAGATEIGEAVEMGTADMSVMLTGYFPQKWAYASAGFEALNIAGAKHGEGAKAYMQLREEFPEVKGEFEDNNQKLLAVWDTPPIGIPSKRPLATMADFQGLTIRSPGVTLGQLFDTVGSKVIAISSSEEYDALSKGIIEAGMATVTTMVKKKLWEVTSYLTYPFDVIGTMPTCYSITINLGVWNKLSPEQQKVLQELGDQLTNNMSTMEMEAVETEMQIVKDAGMEIIPFSQSDVEPWRAKVVRKMYEDYVKTTEERGHPEARKILDRYCELLGFDPYKYPMPQ